MARPHPFNRLSRDEKPTMRYGGDKQMRDLLVRYDCPTPFHKVRTLFLGNIATPRLEASPMQVIKDVWGGELPEFQNIAEVNTLFQKLVSLWNHLTKHQARSARSGLLVKRQNRPRKISGASAGCAARNSKAFSMVFSDRRKASICLNGRPQEWIGWLRSTP